MAESVDAKDLKSFARKGVGVQAPLRVPFKAAYQAALQKLDQKRGCSLVLHQAQLRSNNKAAPSFLSRFIRVIIFTITS